jgi:hypothetical protein
VAALLAAGCAEAAPVAPARRAPPAQARLGWVTWSSPDELIFCNRRVDDAGNPIGVTGPCARQVAGESGSHRIMSWTTVDRPDPAPPDAGPWERCHLELEGSRAAGLQRLAPVRAWLVAPSGRTLVDEWLPDPKLGGDQFAVEASVSREGRWLAFAHVSIGIGDGARALEVASVTIVAVPACR